LHPTTVRNLVRSALRMTPDRVMVGEIHGPEVVPMCNAMSQGNDGSMATLHAASAASSPSSAAFPRLASYAAQGSERLTHAETNLLVATSVHFVVHLDHARDTATRVVSSIREVVGVEGSHVISDEVCRPGPDRGAHRYQVHYAAKPLSGSSTPGSIRPCWKLLAAGGSGDHPLYAGRGPRRRADRPVIDRRPDRSGARSSRQL
jgi:hypothetical protein